MRTSVRVKSRPTLHGTGGARGDSRIGVLHRRTPPSRHAPGRRQSRDDQEVRRDRLAHTDGPFDPRAVSQRGLERRGRPRPLAEVLVENSTYSRGKLKKRLYAEGLKQRRCELCGQGEQWRGRRMALILDHVNGVATDNRLDNLRIVCPNCAATLDTHCGRNIRRMRLCAGCGAGFIPKGPTQRHCSQRCGQQSRASRAARSARRRVERPPYEQLIAEVAATSWVAVGRKYGVTDNAVRKWVRAYERERDAPLGGSDARQRDGPRRGRDAPARQGPAAGGNGRQRDGPRGDVRARPAGEIARAA